MTAEFKWKTALSPSLNVDEKDVEVLRERIKKEMDKISKLLKENLFEHINL